MPIDPIVIQQRLVEVGRIRLGEQVEWTRGDRSGTRPASLDRFRLTSFRSDLIMEAAEAYGGEVTPWESNSGRKTWQVTIGADHLDVIVAPGAAFSQWFELWSGGGCARRCTGRILETLEGKDVRDQDMLCLCPSDSRERIALAAKGQACKPTTRLQVWLPKLKGIGVWRAETHGFYAAAELPATVGFLQGLYEQGYRPTAEMRIGTRTVKRPNEVEKTFPVLELDLPNLSLMGVLDAGAAMPGEAVEVAQIGTGLQEPPTGRIPSSRERRPRPQIGPPPQLPAESDMRKPQPSQPATAPQPVVVTPYAGLDAEIDEGAEVIVNEGPMAPMNMQMFTAIVNSEGLATKVRGRAKKLFGEQTMVAELTDAQRGELLASLRRGPA